MNVVEFHFGIRDFKKKKKKKKKKKQATIMQERKQINFKKYFQIFGHLDFFKKQIYNFIHSATSSCFVSQTIFKKQIYRGYLLFWGEYQIYFIECVENIRIFMRAQHEWKFRCFQLTRWNIFGIHLKKSKFSFYFILFRRFTVYQFVNQS